MPVPPLKELLRAGRSTAFCTTRGVCDPQSPYSGFSLCHYTGDSPLHTAECRDSLCRHFGIANGNIIVPRQTHSSNVAVITSLPVAAADIEGVDAIVTNLPDMIIGVNTADCVPVVLIDPVAGINGVAHAGWRGAVGGVVEATVAAMVRLGSNPADIRAAMGPSICVGCFEVGPEVAQNFAPDCVSHSYGAKPHVSLHKHISKTLLNCGLRDFNISEFDNALCTRCHPSTYWSARKFGINSGRLYTFIVTK